MNEFTYSENEIRNGKAVRDTYVGSVSVTLADGRRVIAFTRNTVAHARDLMAKALSNPIYRNRFVSIIPAR